jgi:hypothetical protein
MVPAGTREVPEVGRRDSGRELQCGLSAPDVPANPGFSIPPYQRGVHANQIGCDELPEISKNVRYRFAGQARGRGYESADFRIWIISDWHVNFIAEASFSQKVVPSRFSQFLANIFLQLRKHNSMHTSPQLNSLLGNLAEILS